MKTKTLILSLVTFFVINNLFSQKNTGAIETVGAGVINFLLKNPKTADKYNPSETQALSTLANVLTTLGERKHEVNVATAAREEITINNNIPAGNQGQSLPQTQENSVIIDSPEGEAKIIMDAQENMYLVYKEKVYPISREIINQAKEFSIEEKGNKFLEPYNLKEVENNFHFSPREIDSNNYTAIIYLVSKGGEYLPDIAEEEGVQKDKIKIKSYKGFDTKKNFKHIFEGTKKLTRGSVLEIYKKNPPVKITPPSKINFLFLCTWANDFAEDGYQFNDFQGIRNYFSKGENFILVAGYQNDITNCKYYLTIFDYKTGEKVFEKIDISPMMDIILHIPIALGEVSQGVYILNFKIKKGNTVLDSKTEKFEIIE